MITFKELIEKQLSFEPNGINDPENYMWDLGSEDQVSGMYYPVTNKKPIKETKVAKKFSSGLFDKSKEPKVNSSGEISISKEEYEELKSYKDKTLISKTFKEVNSSLEEIRNTLIELNKTVSNDNEIVEDVLQTIYKSLSLIRMY